jgi:ribonuclease BN (tRNA processing enzyme)
VHDATYTTDEYEEHRGWGHSTFEDAVTLALDAGVDELVLFHHKPERSDAELDQCLAQARALVVNRGRSLRVTAAAEGMSLSV